MAQREKFDRSDREERRLSQIAAAASEEELDRLMMLRLIEVKPGAAVASRDRLVDLARKIYETRQARSQYFQNSLLGEPAWDMLLALFCLPLARWGKMTVSRLSQAAGLSLTTGLRWSKMMEQKGLINRTSDPLDARRIFVTLSSKGDRLMCDYLSTVHQQLMDD